VLEDRLGRCVLCGHGLAEPVLLLASSHPDRAKLAEHELAADPELTVDLVVLLDKRPGAPRTAVTLALHGTDSLLCLTWGVHRSPGRLVAGGDVTDSASRSSSHFSIVERRKRT
jgi:hypothetical protein